MPDLAADLSLGCGNPTGFADLSAGETVVDLGCGAGMDVILAAGKVRASGHVIGIDFAPNMIERARQAVEQAALTGWDVQLVVGSIEDTGLPGEVADAVISNCVINLTPDKKAVYREAFRILKPGGRLAVSDILFAEHPASDLEARLRASWYGCLGGAAVEGDYWETIRGEGFTEIEVVARQALDAVGLKAIACCPGEDYSAAPPDEDLAVVQGKVLSVKFTAWKPL